MFKGVTCNNGDGERREVKSSKVEDEGESDSDEFSAQDKLILMLQSAYLTQDLWADTMFTIAHVINLFPSKHKGLKLAHELQYYDHLWTFC